MDAHCFCLTWSKSRVMTAISNQAGVKVELDKQAAHLIWQVSRGLITREHGADHRNATGGVSRVFPRPIESLP